MVKPNAEATSVSGSLAPDGLLRRVRKHRQAPGVAGHDHLYPRRRAARLTQHAAQLQLHAAVVELQAAEAARLQNAEETLLAEVRAGLGRQADRAIRRGRLAHAAGHERVGALAPCPSIVSGLAATAVAIRLSSSRVRQGSYRARPRGAFQVVMPPWTRGYSAVATAAASGIGSQMLA